MICARISTGVHGRKTEKVENFWWVEKESLPTGTTLRTCFILAAYPPSHLSHEPNQLKPVLSLHALPRFSVKLILIGIIVVVWFDMPITWSSPAQSGPVCTDLTPTPSGWSEWTILVVLKFPRPDLKAAAP
jgi:hypothetical protein